MFQFPFTRPAAMAVLLLTLTAILAVNSDQKIDEAHYKRLTLGYSYAYLQTPPTEQFFSTRNLFDCTALSLRSQSEFFTYNKVSHVCKNYSPKNIMTVVSTNDKNDISFYKSSEWIKTYAISMGANSLVYKSFLNKGHLSTWNVDKCIGTYCPNFFRHPILDIWNHLPIDQVKFVLYKNQSAVVTMVFDGRNTTLENWFSVNNLKSSPWNDLAQGMIKYFRMVGYRNSRRFYVSSFHNDCPEVAGWITLNEVFFLCDWEKSNHFPTILYSETNSSTIWNDGYGVADSMAIFIQLRQN